MFKVKRRRKEIATLKVCNVPFPSNMCSTFFSFVIIGGDHRRQVSICSSPVNTHNPSDFTDLPKWCFQFVSRSYVAVTGLPQPQDTHALIMARFAFDGLVVCFKQVTRQLEVSLGPDTGNTSLYDSVCFTCTRLERAQTTIG